MSDFALQFVPGGETNAPPAKPAPAPQTNLVEQGMSGLNQGIAQFAGTPVDLVSAAINGVSGLVGGPDELIKDPMLGSEHIRKLMSPTISDVDPQTAAQRYARRIGQEVGFGAPAALTMAGPLGVGAKALPTYMAANAGSDVASAVAGQTSREIAPDNNTADLIVSMLAGGGTAATAERAARRRPPAPTRAQVQTVADDAYDRVRNSKAQLTEDAKTRLSDDLLATMEIEGADAVGYPKATGQVKVIEKNPRPSVYGVEEARRRIRDHVKSSAEEGGMGKVLMERVDKYLANLSPEDLMGADPADVLADLKAGRKAAQTYIKHDEVMDAIDAAKSRTATTGTAGNSLNAQSQEIRKIYDKEVARRPKKANKGGGYSGDEVKAMERIVFPSGGERTLQRIGRLSPTTGGLQAMGTGLGAGAGGLAAVTGNPTALLAAVPAVAGLAAQKAAEKMKTSNIDELVDVILRGGKAAKKTAPDGMRAAIISQLLAGTQRATPR